MPPVPCTKGVMQIRFMDEIITYRFMVSLPYIIQGAFVHVHSH